MRASCSVEISSISCTDCWFAYLYQCICSTANYATFVNAFVSSTASKCPTIVPTAISSSPVAVFDVAVSTSRTLDLSNAGRPQRNVGRREEAGSVDIDSSTPYSYMGSYHTAQPTPVHPLSTKTNCRGRIRTAEDEDEEIALTSAIDLGPRRLPTAFVSPPPRPITAWAALSHS